MYIIYEGPDQVGKTTTRKLVEEQRNGKDVVIDRFIGSNIVYGTVNIRYTLEELRYLYIDDFLFVAKFKPVLIYLYAPVNVLLERIKKDKHEEIDEDHLINTSTEYDRYYERCGYKNKIKINTSKFKQTEVVKQIIKFLKNVENK